MHYTISIQYVKNNKKAGKLSIKDQFGKSILNDVPVGVPPSTPISFNKSNLANSFVKENREYLSVTEDNLGQQYLSILEKISANQLNHIIKSNNEPLFIYDSSKESNNSPLVADTRLFVLAKNHFDLLAKILSDKENTVSVQGERVTFSFGNEQLDNRITSKFEALKELSNIENKINAKTQKENVIEIKKEDKENLETPSNKSSSYFSITSRLLKEDQDIVKKNIETTVAKQKSSLEKLVDFIKSPNHPVSRGSSRSFTSSSHPNGSINNSANSANSASSAGWKSDEGLSEMDVYMVKNNPHLAPFLHPNSVLAWMTYFGTNTSNLSRQEVMDNVNHVKGFEDVAASDFKYTSNGYSVDLYSDEGKNNLLGTLNYDNDSLKIVSSVGDQTYLEQNNNGGWSGYTNTSTGSEVNYNFNPVDNGYTGTWNGYDASGSQIGSTFDANYGYQAPADNTTYNNGYNTGYNNSENNNYNNYNNTPEQNNYTPPPPTYEEPVYTPPPPTWEQNTTQDWNNNNNYGGGFAP